MKLTAIKTRRMEPPQDNLYSILDEALPELQNDDVLVVASKVIAIHEGRCISDVSPKTKSRLIKEESDHIIPTQTANGWDLTIKNNMVTFAGGIDESNVGKYLLLLPKDPIRSAKMLREHLLRKHKIQRLGIVITDSSTLPYRQGVIALSIAHAGFDPVISHVGVPDLFGRPLVCTHVNVVDALAVSAGFVMGETNESTPVCLARNVPRIVFTDEDHSDDLLINPQDDVFYPLLKGTYRK